MRQSPTQHNSRKYLPDWQQSEVPPEVPMSTRLPAPCPSACPPVENSTLGRSEAESEHSGSQPFPTNLPGDALNAPPRHFSQPGGKKAEKEVKTVTAPGKHHLHHLYRLFWGRPAKLSVKCPPTASRAAYPEPCIAPRMITDALLAASCKDLVDRWA